MKSSLKGFTLIELVVVITILGILAAIALPRFAQMQADARIAKMNGALGSMRAAAALAHANLLSRNNSSSFTGNPPAGVNDVNMEGTDVVFVFGYPDAATIATIAGVAAPDYVVTVGATTTVTPDAGHAACSIIYTPSAAANALPTYNVAGLTVANCQ